MRRQHVAIRFGDDRVGSHQNDDRRDADLRRPAFRLNDVADVSSTLRLSLVRRAEPLPSARQEADVRNDCAIRLLFTEFSA